MAGRLRRVAGLCCLAAGLLHAGLSPEHFAEWWGYGAFFVAAAFAQALVGVALLSDAFRAPDAAPGAAAWDRRVLWAGLVGNLALVAFYLWTRTVGIPGGPAAGTAEAVTPVGVATKALELVAAGALALELARRRLEPAPAGAGLPEPGLRPSRP